LEKDRKYRDVHADQDTEMKLDRTYTEERMKPLKERPWIGTHRGKAGEGDLYIHG
jgi:hypothetical protein